MKVISWKQRLVTLVAVGAWLVAAGGPSAADASPPAGSVDIAWDRVLGANPDALDEGQKEKAAAIMNEEKVY